jgi:hypothetical protein
MRRAPAAALLALLTVSCGARSMKLPAAVGTPAPDAIQALADATTACRAISTTAAEAAITGSIGGQRVRARLALGLAAPASARLEAFAVGQRIFTLVSAGGDATLLLEQEQRRLDRAPTEAVVEALTGLPLGTSELKSTLTGCADAPESAEGRQPGPDWRVVTAGTRTYYLQRAGSSAPWRLVAVVHRDPRVEWRAEYRMFVDGLPHDVRLRAAEQHRVDLRLEMSQVELNEPLGPAVFQVTIPQAFAPMTLEELRRSAPFGAGRSE